MNDTTETRTATRRRFLTAAGAAGATALAGCTGGEEIEEIEESAETAGGSGGGTETTTEGSGGDADAITITQGNLVATLDPQNHGETPTTNVLRQAYETLLFRDADGRLVGQLATDWERVEAGRVDLTLREGVEFHSGSALTASDAAYSINRVVDDEVDIVSARKDQLPGIDEATADDEAGVVTIRSGAVNPTVFSDLATTGNVLEEAWVAENDIAQGVNGTGAYELVEYEEDVSITFERFDGYWGEEPAVREVTFNAASEVSSRVSALLAGETDLTVNVPPNEVPRIEEQEGTDITAVPSTRIIFAPMRYDVEPFSSPEFRRALNYAVDLDSIIENVLDGFGDPTSQATLSGYTGHNDDVEPYPHDPERAEELVEESGHAGAEITLETPVGRYLRDVEIAETVAGFIDDLDNVSCSVQQREFGALVQEIVDGKLETRPAFHLIGFGNPTFDAARNILPYLVSDGAWMHWADDRVDELMAQAGEEGDPEEREALLEEANAIIHEEAPWVFLNRQYSVYGVSDRIEWDARRDERIVVKEMELA